MTSIWILYFAALVTNIVLNKIYRKAGNELGHYSTIGIIVFITLVVVIALIK